MKVLFTGATGVVGRVAVPLLVGAAHDVTAVTRTDEGREWLNGVGARPVEVDLFDEDDVDTATRGTDAVINFATRIPSLALMVKVEPWAMNDQVRDRATSLLVDAARAHGVERFIQESITFFYADGGSKWLDESAPVDTSFTPLASAITAEGHVERLRGGGGVGVSLRRARLYGPGAVSREYVEAMRVREIPVWAGAPITCRASTSVTPRRPWRRRWTPPTAPTTSATTSQSGQSCTSTRWRRCSPPPSQDVSPVPQ